AEVGLGCRRDGGEGGGQGGDAAQGELPPEDPLAVGDVGDRGAVADVQFAGGQDEVGVVAEDDAADWHAGGGAGLAPVGYWLVQGCIGRRRALRKNRWTPHLGIAIGLWAAHDSGDEDLITVSAAVQAVWPWATPP